MNAPLAVWQRAIMEAEQDFTELAAIDGNLVNFTRESGFAMQIIGSGGDYIQKCTPESIRRSVINVANIGLTLNPAMKLAYLVPRKLNGVVTCCLDISYIGLVKIATDSGSVLAVSAIPVRMNDTFKWRGPFELPEHVFDIFAPAEERGDIRGVYTAARLASGVTQIDVMRREEIDYIRQLSQASRDDAPWKAWFEEMCKKTGIKRASKLWTRTERLAKAEAILNEHQGIEIPVGGHDATGETRTGPAAVPPAEPAATAGAAEPKAAAKAEEKKDEKGLSDGAKTTIRKAMERNGKKEEDLVAAGFPKVDEMPFSRFQAAMDWVKKK